MKSANKVLAALLAGMLFFAALSACFAAPVRPPLIGAYYFDGWADTTAANFHMNGLTGKFARREPLSGWYDNSARLVHQQIEWAARARINFFMFDWFNTAHDPAPTDQTINSALHFFQADRHKMGMKYALLYVNNGPFSISPAAWKAQCRDWVTNYFKSAFYQTIQGKPLLAVFSPGDMEKTWGSPAKTAEAWQQLQTIAHKAGLPGVYVAACTLPGPKYGWPDLNRTVQEGYDAFTGYNYPGVAGTVKGSNPYSLLYNGSLDIFNMFAHDGRRPFLPVIMTGWDPRPWHETDFWYRRSPQEFARLVQAGLNWWQQNPGVRVEKNRPVLLVEAWNELGEGSYILPTQKNGFSYLNALRKAVDSWKPKP